MGFGRIIFVFFVSLLQFRQFVCEDSGSRSNSELQQSCCKVKNRKVLLSHDGGNDDFVALLLLLLDQSTNIEVVGIAITPADCFPEDALIITNKLLHLVGRSDIPVAVGRLGGLHPFPPEFRGHPSYLKVLPDLINLPDISSSFSPLNSHEFIIDVLKKSEDKSITVLELGPPTNLIHALQQCGQECADKIDEVVWMGGALDVPGNVYDRYHDGYAEWNAYWDPWSSQQLVRSGLNLTIYPLDVTNYAPLTIQFMQQLAKLQKDVAQLVVQIYAGTFNQVHQYYMWDVLTTAHILVDDLVQLKILEVDFLTDNFVEGKMQRAPGSGQWVQVALIPDMKKFNNLIFNTFKKDFKEKFCQICEERE